MEVHKEKTFINPYYYYVFSIRATGKAPGDYTSPRDLHPPFPVFATTLSQLFPLFPLHTLDTPTNACKTEKAAKLGVTMRN